MRVQLTNAGAALLDANTGPIQVSTFKLGSAFDYVPAPTDTDIHGSLVYTGSPSQYFVVNANVVKYSVLLDYSLGPFAFGEIGLYTSTGVLFALAANDSLLSKIPVTSPGGNAIRADIYLSMVNQNYEMWLDYADTNNNFRMAVLQSVDQLPPTAQAAPNAYIITGAVAGGNDGQQSAFLAYTDRSGLWNFDAYAFANQKEATIVACDSQSVTINNTDYVDALALSYYGQIIAQFSTGVDFSICRYVSAVVKGSTQTVISFDNSLMQLPIVGDKIVFFARQALSTTIPNLPIATTTTLGAIKVGTSLTITGDGTLNVNSTAYPVLSVNGMTGDVVVAAADIPGLATVAKTGQYSDILGAPGQYILPIATTTTVGGIKGPTDGNLTIAGDGTIDFGFAPVKTINGTSPDGSGNVTLSIPSMPVGLVAPTQISSGADLNNVASYTKTGIYFANDADASSILNSPTTAGFTLDVESFSTSGNGASAVQRLMTGGAMFFRRYNATSLTWTAWVQTQTSGTLPVATTSNLGVVIVGTGLNVTGAGVLSTQIQTVNGHNDQNISLSASDVSAIPTSAVDAYGGTPSLDVPDPSGLLPATDPFTYGRLNFWQNSLGTWQTAGTWDASANHVAQVYGLNTIDTNTSLVANGKQLIDISFDGIVRGGLITTNPDYQTVSAEGYVYQVTVAGTTSLDGITSWAVGDLAVGVNGKWIKIPKTAYTLPIATSGTLGGVKDGNGVTIAGDGTLSVDGVTSNSFSSTGYRTNPDGTIEMFGIASFPIGTNQIDVTLPVPVPNGILSWSLTDGGSTCIPYGAQLLNSTTLRMWAPAYLIDQSGGTVIARSLIASGSWSILVH